MKNFIRNKWIFSFLVIIFSSFCILKWKLYTIFTNFAIWKFFLSSFVIFILFLFIVSPILLILYRWSKIDKWYKEIKKQFAIVEKFAVFIAIASLLTIIATNTNIKKNLENYLNYRTKPKVYCEIYSDNTNNYYIISVINPNTNYFICLFAKPKKDPKYYPIQKFLITNHSITPYSIQRYYPKKDDKYQDYGLFYFHKDDFNLVISRITNGIKINEFKEFKKLENCKKFGKPFKFY